MPDINDISLWSCGKTRTDRIYIWFSPPYPGIPSGLLVAAIVAWCQCGSSGQCKEQGWDEPSGLWRYEEHLSIPS